MDATDTSSPGNSPGAGDDATAAYRVTAPPTGGPGGWPSAAPMGEAREVFEQVVRETDEAPLRQAIRVALTVVVIVIVTMGTIAWQDLDDRVDRQERQVQQLEQQVQELEARD